MLAPLLIGVSLFGLFGHKPPPGLERHRLDAWTYQVLRDRFTGRVSCSLSGRNVSYAKGAVTFHYPRNVDTSQAIYRIDDGPVLQEKDAEVELLRMHVPLPDQSASNPSGGQVMVPASQLLGARQVSIRARPRAGVRRFSVAGLSAALAAARADGCDPQRTFN